MNPNVTFFLIGFFVALFIVAIICIIKRQIRKRKDFLKITSFEKSKGYKLTILSSSLHKGKFFILDTKEDLIKKIKKYPRNTYVEVNKQPMRIENVDIAL